MTVLYKKKVHAYVTREKEGAMQLLVFKHRDTPEALVYKCQGEQLTKGKR